MSKTLKFDGKTIEITATSDIKSGDAVDVGDMIAVALTDIANGATGTATTENVHNLPKVTGTGMSQGDTVYLNTDGKVTNTATDNNVAGKAWRDAASGDTQVLVKINA
ncbi:MAG: DUF2190 family protein [Pseudomonadota bacterium]